MMFLYAFLDNPLLAAVSDQHFPATNPKGKEMDSTIKPNSILNFTAVGTVLYLIYLNGDFTTPQLLEFILIMSKNAQKNINVRSDLY